MTGKIKSGAIVLFLCWVFVSCKNKPEQAGEKPLARAYDKYLYPSELNGLLGDNPAQQDSVKIVEEYIDNWIRHNLVLKISEDNLQSRLEDINEQAKNYRESLLIYAYERQWLAENLDTIVTEDSIKSYYNAHTSEFLLNTDIYKFSYAIIGKEVKSYDSLKNWFSGDILKFRIELEKYCQANCIAYMLDADTWWNEEALFKLFPLPVFNNGRLRTNGIVEYADENNRYLVKVNEFITNGNLAPYNYVHGDIEKIIINKRKLEALKSNYQNMYSDAFKKNNAEIYKPEK